MLKFHPSPSDQSNLKPDLKPGLKLTGHYALSAILIGLSLGLGVACRKAAHLIVNPSGAALTPPLAQTAFVIVGGGGHPSYNEIALEKNILYFQRTLANLQLQPNWLRLFFANGTNHQATVRYINAHGEEAFKAPDIPGLDGAATYYNLAQTFASLKKIPPGCPTFFYFTGHGAYHERNPDNNSIILWQEQLLSVRTLASWLDKLPAEQPFVTMMAQCYAGSFANLIYEQGDPAQPVALQSRCGFFATVAERPSVGCTPAVNEADYRDYSSSFFAGLSGIDRTGQPVANADYDQNGQVSYAEAHAFAKVDEATSDWPISTAEAWLQRQATPEERQRIVSQPLQDWVAITTPQRQYVVRALSHKLHLSLAQSYQDQQRPVPPDSISEAYWRRLEMELINIAMIQTVNASEDEGAIATLQKLTTCEASSWQP